MIKSSGFTLIELMVTLAIIGVLMGIVSPQFQKLHLKSQNQALKGVSRSLQLAIETYFVSYGHYPRVGQGSITALISELNRQETLIPPPTNPFTRQLYTDSDASGLIQYSHEQNRYSLQAFGDQNHLVVWSSNL